MPIIDTPKGPVEVLAARGVKHVYHLPSVPFAIQHSDLTATKGAMPQD